MARAMTARTDAHVMTEKAQALAETQSMSLLINTLLALSAATILWLDHPDLRLACWLPLTIIANLFRWACLCSSTWRARLAMTPALTLRMSVLGSAWSGVMWGCLPLVLMNFDSIESPFVSIILCGLTAGAAVQGGAYALPVMALSVPILTPMAARFAMMGKPSGYFLAFDILLYLGMILRSSRSAESNFSKLADLRWQAAGLANDLKRQNEASLASADKFYQLANHDPLTGLANRAAFSIELTGRLAQERPDRCLTLLLLDLDHFKAINDTLGHGTGDEVLQAVAARLDDIADGRRFVARLGGDEFAILVGGDPDDVATTDLVEELIARVGAPLIVGGEPIDVSCSIGLACHPVDATRPEDLLARADLALYAAKNAGRRTWRSFEPHLLSAAEFAREIERDLASAIAAKTLEVWFQPQVDLDSRRLIGMEALLRWYHPTLGLVDPQHVVAAAVKTRQSRALTGHVLERTFEMIGDLDSADLGHVGIGVNISPRELSQYDINGLVEELLVRHAVAPERLELEITEEATLTDQGAIDIFSRLRAHGVRVAIDDFGTGNSSIAYIRKFTLDRIKVDRSFVTEIATSAGDRALIQAVVSMGRSLGVEVLAEGVETEEQAQILGGLGCRLAQGYLFGRAAPRQWLRDGFIAAHPSAADGEPALCGPGAG